MRLYSAVHFDYLFYMTTGILQPQLWHRLIAQTFIRYSIQTYVGFQILFCLEEDNDMWGQNVLQSQLKLSFTF